MLAEAADRLLELAHRLPPPDQSLVEAVLRHGQSIASLARLTGRSRHQVVRRLARLIRRMRQPRFRSADVHLPLLTSRQQRLARLWIFGGLGIRRVARRTETSIFTTRKELSALGAKLKRLDAGLHLPGEWPPTK